MMINSKFSVKIRTSDSALESALEAMALNAGGLRVLASGSKERPDLLIFELSENFDEEFKRLQSILSSNGVGEVFVSEEDQEILEIIRLV